MISNRKLRAFVFLLNFSLMLGPVACKRSTVSKPSETAPNTAPNVSNTAQGMTLPPGAYAFIHGVWEGTLGDPLGWSIRFDCFARNGIQKLLVSITGNDFQLFYFPINYGLEGDALNLWWNDEANRATMKLRLGQGRQLTGTFSQLQKGGPVSAVFSKTSNVPQDGAATYHGTWE
ncbi:MAG: hypothetical protein LBH03_00835 [Holophagales bacterium]|jgi:hypothetical protein|nr:hypothetical protein [Holophagales bacterium]